MITYRGLRDVPRELVAPLAGRLARERRARGTRTGTRALTCGYQAVLVLVWYRTGEDIALRGAGFGVSRATAYHSRDEAVRVLAATAPDRHDARRRGAEGWSPVILDGTLVTTDRCAPTTTRVQGTTLDAGYSRQRRTVSGTMQAVRRPDGLPVWTPDALPGNLHDLTCAHHHELPGALCWAASQLRLPTLADAGYDSVGHGIDTPGQAPADGRRRAPDNQAYHALLRSLHAVGERGFALLPGRWRCLRHVTISPTRTGDRVSAALVLTHVEHHYLPNSC